MYGLFQLVKLLFQVILLQVNFQMIMLLTNKKVTYLYE